MKTASLYSISESEIVTNDDNYFTSCGSNCCDCEKKIFEKGTILECIEKKNDLEKMFFFFVYSYTNSKPIDLIFYDNLLSIFVHIKVDISIYFILCCSWRSAILYFVIHQLFFCYFSRNFLDKWLLTNNSRRATLQNCIRHYLWTNNVYRRYIYCLD
jgi:hypothetical protein